MAEKIPNPFENSPYLDLRDKIKEFMDETCTQEPGSREPDPEAANSNGNARSSEPPTDKPTSPGELETSIISKCFTDIAAKPIEWFWPDKIAAFKLNNFDGPPDVGKTTVLCDLIARYTTPILKPDGTPNERTWPDGTPNTTPPGDVLMVIGEDDEGDTIRPRLEAAGADLSRVHFLASVRVSQGGKKLDRQIALDTDLKALETYLEQHPNTGLVTLDPVTHYFGKCKINSDQEVRTVLGPIKELAERRRVTFLTAGHLNKRSDVSGLDRVGGSVAMTGVGRGTWLFGKSGDVDGEYLMVLGKSNLSKIRTGLTYRIVEKFVEIDGKPYGHAVIEWGSATDAKADTVFNTRGNRESKKKTRATEWLVKFLADSAKPSADVFAEGNKVGLSRRTLFRAKEEMEMDPTKPMEIVASRLVFGGEWYWELAPKGAK